MCFRCVVNAGEVPVEGGEVGNEGSKGREFLWCSTLSFLLKEIHMYISGIHTANKATQNKEKRRAIWVLFLFQTVLS